jgi:hypothetical protein
MPYKILSRFAETVGDGSGGQNAIGNYTNGGVTPLGATEFKLTAQSNEHISIERMIVSIVDGAITNADAYAGAGVLSNGIKLYVTDSLGATQYNLTDPDIPVTTVGDWAHYCHDLTIWAGLAGGDDHATVRWTFARSGKPVVLLPGWSINVLCQDSFATLTKHRFLLQGYWLQPTIGADEGHA